MNFNKKKASNHPSKVQEKEKPLQIIRPQGIIKHVQAANEKKQKTVSTMKDQIDNQIMKLHEIQKQLENVDSIYNADNIM